jgi:hypothetical protein
MRRYLYKKIVYNKITRDFVDKLGYYAEEIEDADQFDIDEDDEDILENYDEDVRDDLEIWKIKIIFQTMIEL